MSSVKLLETKMKKAETMRMEKNIVMFQSGKELYTICLLVCVQV